LSALGDHIVNLHVGLVEWTLCGEKFVEGLADPVGEGAQIVWVGKEAASRGVYKLTGLRSLQVNSIPSKPSKFTYQEGELMIVVRLRRLHNNLEWDRSALNQDIGRLLEQMSNSEGIIRHWHLSCHVTSNQCSLA